MTTEQLYPDRPPGKYSQYLELIEWHNNHPKGMVPRPSFVYRHVSLFQTCPAYPEQYDAKNEDGIQVGYLRLRGGQFRVDVPYASAKTIFKAAPKGDGFFEDDEREGYLMEAIDAILEHRE
jgi:hypothetical protein